MHTDEPNSEVDASAIYRPEAQGLHQTRGLEDTLGKFGYSKDDRIPRRELVVMYNSTKKAIEEEIVSLARSNHYDSAKESSNRLRSLRGEFDALQTNAVVKNCNDQNKYFEQGSVELKRDIKKRHDKELGEVNEYIAQKKEEMRRFHQIQQENLDLEIARIPRPNTKYSKRLIELMKSENSLIRLNQYEEARKVRLMIERILPKEESQFQSHFEQQMQSMRDKLYKQQQDDLARLEEKLKAVEWTDIRRRQMELDILDQNLMNHRHDMSHSHTMESKLKPEMSVTPSALWQKRPGYRATAASLRGEQLVGFARGKKQGEQILNDKIVDRHDFDMIPMNTIVLEKR